MGVFNRVKDIVTANINSLLDKAEDPSKMLRLMIQEMEDTIIDLKSSCAAQLAEKKSLERNIREAASKVSQWEERAKLALEKGREDLAREALLEKKHWGEKSEKLKESYELTAKGCEDSRNDILELEKKLITVKNKYKELISRARKAQEAQKFNVYSNTSRMEEMERHIDKMESSMEFKSSALEDEFSKLEGDSSIDNELEELKKSLKKGDK